METVDGSEPKPPSTDETAHQIWLGVLGPLIGRKGADELTLGGPKQLAVLAMLVAAAPSTVSADTIAQAIYGEDAPARARRRVQTYVSTLRAVLGDAIVRQGDGWQLRPDHCIVDAVQFEAQIARADRLRADEASRVLAEALALWRGSPYSGIEARGPLDAEIRRLDELYLHVLERRIDADLDAGGSADLVPELAALVAQHPYREGLWSRHMTALYRSGRQQEALHSFEELRRVLLEDLGVDPTPELRELEQQILRQDQTLRAEPEPRGRPLRGYRLLEEIGSGAFSIVWRGVQPSVDREVAIKQIRSELTCRPEFIRRFEAEAQLIARIEHPHIVPLIDYWRDPDSAYLVMRWLRGGTIERSLEGGPWSVERTVRMARQIGEGLAEAHARGVIHRDVKAANILLDENGNAFLGDFGIAFDALASDEADAAASHGSSAYAAPELLRKEPVGPEADVFSFGVVLYHCLTGDHPFPAATDGPEMVRRQLTEEYLAIDPLRPAIPHHIAEAVARATAEAPEDRFESVLDFVDALELDGTIAQASDRAGRRTPQGGELENPYKGLRTFDEGDSNDFFGRDRLVDEFIHQLGGESVGSRCLTVVGPSGSGKSSVVRAGLLPALRSGMPADADQWFITTMVPGAHPFEALEAALLRVAVNPPTTLLHQLSDGPRGILRSARRCLPSDQDHVLLVIDQLEELFTVASPDRADRFLSALAVAVEDPASSIRVVATLRADYYDRPLAHPQFAAVLKAGSVDVTPLAPDELESAIASPAERNGFTFEAGLVARIAAEALGQPAPLPLLQYALSEVVERCSGSTLTASVYEQIGGLAGSLNIRAEELYQAGSPGEQASTRRVFGRLANPDQATGDLRRRVTRADLGDGAETQAVLDRYGEARLLTFDRDAKTREPTVEVAHEALLREWPRLSQWLEDDRQLLRSIGHLAGSANAWHEAGGASTDLYRGGRLESAAEILSDTPGRLRPLDREYVAASLGAAEAEREHEQIRVRRLRRLVAGVGVALVLALIAGGVAFQQQRRADDEAALAAENESAALENADLARANAEEATSQRELADQRAVSASARGLAAQATALADRELDTALLLAANAAALEPSLAAEEGLLNVLNQASYLESSGPFPGPEGLLTATSAGGTTVGFYSDGLLRAFDAATDKPAGPEIEVGTLAMQDSISIDDEGTIVAIRTETGAAAWRVATGELLVDGIMADQPDYQPGVSAGGRYLIMQEPSGGPIQVYSIEDGEYLGEAVIEGVRGQGRAVTSQDDGRLYWTVQTAQGEQGVFAVFELPTLEQVVDSTTLGIEANLALPSNDKSVIAVAATVPEGEVTFLDGESLEPLSPTVSLNAGRLAGAMWNPSSTRLLAGSLSSEFAVLSAASFTIEAQVLGRASPFQAAGWIDDDRFFVVVDGHKMVWNLANRATLAAPLAPAHGLDVFRDGRTVLNTGATLDVVSPTGARSSIDLDEELIDNCGPVYAEPLGNVATLICGIPDPSGERILSFAMFEVQRGVALSSAVVVEDDFGFIDFAPSPDGTRLALAGSRLLRGGEAGGLLALIDVSSGQFVQPPTSFDPWVMITVAWSGDGSLLLAAGQTAEILFIDPETWEVTDRVPTSPDRAVTDITFDSTGTIAYAATELGEVWAIDVETREILGSPLSGATSQFQSASVSPDGSRAAATGRDGDIRIWDTGTGRLVGTKLQGGDARFVRFTDNDTLVSWGRGSQLQWDIGIDALQRTACRLAGRPLNDSELANFASDLPLGDACR